MAGLIWLRTTPSPTLSSAVFQTVGAGAHDIAPLFNKYRNAGTTNIPSWLLTDLMKRTTFPPVLLTNTITVSTNLVPVVARCTDLPDLGFNYSAIDFAANQFTITNNATVNISPGTIIAAWGSSAIRLAGGSRLISEGAPLQMNRILRYNAVQEQATNWGAGTNLVLIDTSHSSNAAPSISLRFTEMSIPPSGGDYLSCLTAETTVTNFQARDSLFLGGRFNTYELWSDTFAFTNNLFDRVDLEFYNAQIYFYNNLMRGGRMFIAYVGGAFKDNLFDGTAIQQNANPDCNYNAYVRIPDATRLPTSGTNNFELTNFVYATGPLGNFYQLSTNLFNRGSRNATNAGLYHFTTTADQKPETNRQRVTVHSRMDQPERHRFGHERWREPRQSTGVDDARCRRVPGG